LRPKALEDTTLLTLAAILLGGIYGGASLTSRVRADADALIHEDAHALPEGLASQRQRGRRVAMRMLPAALAASGLVVAFVLLDRDIFTDIRPGRPVDPYRLPYVVAVAAWMCAAGWMWWLVLAVSRDRWQS
jgi:hypothetical protein